MYYHNSPTTTQLKQIKALRAHEMKEHLKAMKAISAKYSSTIRKLEKLREQELMVENESSTGRLSDKQLAHYQDIIASNRKKAARLVAKLTDQVEQSL